MRNLTLEGNITVFKSLTLFKIVHLCLTSVVPKETIEEIENIQKKFLWNGSTSKIKHNNTLCNSLGIGGLSNGDINTKFESYQCSWIKRLYDGSSHEGKLIPLHLINKTVTPTFKLHPSLSLSFQLGHFP